MVRVSLFYDSMMRVDIKERHNITVYDTAHSKCSVDENATGMIVVTDRVL